MQKNKNIHYIHFDTIDSTNNWVKKNAQDLDPRQITCVTALEQTAGRGRFHRHWISPKGQNIYATFYFTLPKESRYIENLAQLLSFSCATVLKSKGFSPQIKWPNDLLLERKKVAGILCEVVFFEEYIGIILGIGINVNMGEELLNAIDQPTTSLAQLSGHSWTFEQILDPLIKQFFTDLDRLKQEGFRAFADDYNALLAFKNEEIACQPLPSIEAKTLRGICLGVDDNGQLLLRLSSGETASLASCDFKPL